jgi:hypothetical protein
LIAKYIANGNLLASQMLLAKKEKELDSINNYVTLLMVSSNSVTDNIMKYFKESDFRKGFYQLAGGSENDNVD